MRALANSGSLLVLLLKCFKELVDSHICTFII